MTLNLNTKITEAADKAIAVGGLIAALAMAAAETNPTTAAIADGVTVFGLVLAGIGLAAGMAHSLVAE